MKKPFGRLIKIIKQNFVTAVAFVAAAVTCFFVPPDAEYIGYFDFATLSCLFCTLAVVMALRHIKFFTYLARKIISFFGSERMCLLALAGTTFIGSMFMANDMALVTFLPLGCMVMGGEGREKITAYTLVMQNTAANLGGMVTPFGNPQNLYLYSLFKIDTAEFMRIMLPPFLLATAMIAVCCTFISNKKMRIIQNEKIDLPPLRTAFYGLLFVISLLTVFRVIPYWMCFVIVFVSLLIADRKAIADVDYGLLLTFVFFFVFSGNLSRIEAVGSFFGYFLDKSVLLSSVVSCQLISNVPTAVLLSRFTANYKPLLMGVNIGGVGTPISSLASLITLREYQHRYPGKLLMYLCIFTAVSFSFLIILTLFCFILL